MKNILLFVLAILLTSNTYAQYTLTDNDVVVEGGVLKEYTNTTEKNIIIPEILDGQTITVLGETLFYSKGMTGVDIPNTVTSIEFRALNGNSFTSLDIPNSVTSIADFAIKGNQDLTSITLSNSVIFIGEAAFNGCSIATVNGEPFDGIFYKRNPDGSEDKTTIISYGGASKVINFIPSSVTTINNSAFRRNRLVSVVIPNNVTSVGDYAFAYNYLTNVSISNSLTKLSTGIFTDNKLTSITIPSSITETGYNSLGVNELTSIVIPSSLTKIGGSTFRNNNLTNVTIPNSVREIGSSAFMLNKLTNVILPNSLKIIDQYSFYGNELTSIVIPNTVTTIHRNSFASNKLVNVTIPNSVTQIGDAAFTGNEITSVEIPSSVTKIYEKAFNGNKISLINGKTSDGIIYSRKADGTDDTSMIVSYGGGAKIIDFIPTSVKVIGNYAFYSNGLPLDLTRVDLPNSITTIGREAFSYNKLTNIIIPKSVTEIDYGAFVSNQITSIILPAAEKSGYLFINWNGNIEANTEVSELWNKYTANFEIIETLSENIIETSRISIYPNPTTSNLFITNDAKNKLSFKVIDINGRVIIERTSSNYKIKLNLEGYPSGIYNIIIEFNGNSIVNKIIKK